MLKLPLTGEQLEHYTKACKLSIANGFKPLTQQEYVDLNNSMTKAVASGSIVNLVSQLESLMGLKPTLSTDAFREASEQLHDALEKEYGEIELGDTVVDTVSGFKGKATCINVGIEYTNVEVQPSCTDDTKLPKAEWFQIERLEKQNEL